MEEIIKSILQRNIRYFWAFLMETATQDILFYFSKLDSSKYFPYLAIGCFGMYLFCGIESGKLERTHPIPGNVEEDKWLSRKCVEGARDSNERTCLIAC